MKVIIAGSRSITDYLAVSQAINEAHFDITEVVSGGAPGVDRLGEKWAKIQGIPIKQFLAEWGKRGKKAGYLRNVEMAKYADSLILVWDNRSHGSRMMREIAKDFDLHMFEKIIKVPKKEDEFHGY